MASPPHDDLGWDAELECGHDERPAAAMGREELVFGLELLVTHAALEVDRPRHRVEASRLAQILQAGVHGHLARHWQSHRAGRRRLVGVLVEYGRGVFVQLDAQGVGGLLRDDGYVLVAMHVATPQLGNVRVAQPREAAEEEHVSNVLENLVGGRVAHQLPDLVTSAVYDFVRRAADSLDPQLERVVAVAVIVAVVVRPSEEELYCGEELVD